MRVVILIDNNPDPEGRYLIEHGISIYFEADGLKWLLDVGASPNFAINARRLGIDISNVDFLILSHAHRDHTGGLEYFLRKNKKARIVMAPLNSGELFISYRKQIHHNITIDHSIIEAFYDRFDFKDNDFYLSQNVRLIRKISTIDPLPRANSLLFHCDRNGERPDDFNHEVALTVTTPKGIILFSGCSHHGLLNILRSSSQSLRGLQMIATIGGTHLLDSDDYTQFETSSEITHLLTSVAHQYPDMDIITGHCTGLAAQEIFSCLFHGRYHLFHSGAIYNIG